MECGNYRAISLLSVTGKVYCIHQSITTPFKEIRGRRDEWRTGGIQEGRGTMEQIFVVRRLPEKYTEMNRTLYNNFIDNVWQKGLWRIMRHCGVPQRRQSGLKSGGSWIRVKKSIFSRQISEKFRFFQAFSRKISDFSWQIFEKFQFFPAIFKKFRFSRQKLLIYSYFWANYSISLQKSSLKYTSCTW